MAGQRFTTESLAKDVLSEVMDLAVVGVDVSAAVGHGEIHEGQGRGGGGYSRVLLSYSMAAVVEFGVGIGYAENYEG